MLGRDYPEPIGGRPYRPCVGVMLLNKDGKVWIGERDTDRDGPQLDFAWQMPQGGIDAGEEPRDAAARELYEETSVRSIALLAEAPQWFAYDYPPEVAASSRGGKYCGQAQRWFAFRFQGQDSEIDVLSPPHGHQAEFRDWRWERADRLPELIVPFKRPVYEAVVRAFAHLTS
ncbi:MAG: RNA pyrophosphohydrolase [Roseibium sp.]|nr:RNA pyrophosphohydrolase [Roseibium sp.]